MLRDGRPRDVETGRDLAGCQLPIAHEFQDASAAGLRDGSNDDVHGVI